MKVRHLFTSESVTEGHPDKLADQISDSILDAILKDDPHARVAAETLVTTGLVFVAGEISTQCYVDVASLVRKTILDTGYTSSACGFDGNTCAILTPIDEQSSDIAEGVNHAFEARSGKEADEIGAGDQGMVFGFACDETPELMPLPISLAHALSRRLAEVRKEGTLPYLRPDGKTQVTIEYGDRGPARVDAIVVSAQHEPQVTLAQLEVDLRREVIDAVVPAHLVDGQTRVFVNPSGRFVIGGPQADTGLTGRKIIVDTYGGYARHGGGAFSGKDPTKVDRSASYAARWAAKNVVAAQLAKRCEIQVAYAIGMARPVSLRVETFGTGVMDDEALSRAVRQVFDFRPAKIIEALDLRRPIYQQTAAYGHFGRPDLELSWEALDRVGALKAAAKIGV